MCCYLDFGIISQREINEMNNCVYFFGCVITKKYFT